MERERGKRLEYETTAGVLIKYRILGFILRVES